MREVSLSNFGILVAYLLPGVVALWGVRRLSPHVQAWFSTSSEAAPTVGGFLYLTLAALGAGLAVSTLRWLLLDKLHALLGLRAPDWNFAKLPARLEAFELLVESHYRYYQLYGNMLISLVVVYLVAKAQSTANLGLLDIACLSGIGLCWIGSRDTLRKYYQRTSELLR